jgi:hypothetical protein
VAINTYATLKTAVQNWSKRSDTLSVIDDFIDLAEAEMWSGPTMVADSQPLRVRAMEARATATTSTTDRFLALPTGYLEMRKLRLKSGNNNYDLNFRVPEALNVKDSSSIPTDYAITEELEFNCIPASAYTAEMHYYKKLTALSSSNTSNDILTNYPNVYLFGCLYHFGLWAMNDNFVQKYGPLFRDAIKAANKSDKKGRFGPGKAMRIEGPTP